VMREREREREEFTTDVERMKKESAIVSKKFTSMIINVFLQPSFFVTGCAR